MTYDELVANILAWANKPEIEPSIATFIALAEAQMNRELTEAGVVGATQRDTSTINAEYAGVPTDFDTPQTLTVGGYDVANVTALGMEELRARFPNQAAARPTHYTVIGSQFRFWPIPDNSYPAVLTYVRTIPALSSTVTSNWVLANHPDAYLYGALAQSAPFLGDDARLTTWGGLFTSALASIVTNERSKRGSQATPGFRAHVPNRDGCGLSAFPSC